MKMPNRIAALRNERDLTQPELAERIGCNHSTISRLESGRRKLTLEWMEKIAAALGCQPADLLHSGPRSPHKGGLRQVAPRVENNMIEVDGSEYLALPSFDAALSAGAGSLMEIEPEPIGYHLIESQWLRSITRAAPEYLMVVRVDGDSMEPVLSDGDWILVDTTQRRLDRQGIYALRIGSAVWVKRISLNLKEQMVQVISDNSVYPMQELREEELEPIGRVLCVLARKL